MCLRAWPFASSQHRQSRKTAPTAPLGLLISARRMGMALVLMRGLRNRRKPKMIQIDMAKAIEIQRNRIRAAREPLLAALDVEFMRAVERGDQAEQARVVAEKQRLRDLTNDPRLTAAQTVDELKIITV
jgi:hypothetical protein